MYRDPPHFSWDMLCSAHDAPVKVRDTLQGENTLTHTHDFIEIALVHKGKGTHIKYLNDGGKIANTIIRGDVFVILPGDKHSYANCRGYGVYNICITVDFFNSLDKELSQLEYFSKFFSPEYSSGVNQLHLLPEAFFVAHAKLRRLAQAIGMDSASKLLAIRLTLTDFLYTVFDSGALNWESAVSDTAPELFQSILRLEANPEKKFDLKSVARQTGMSSSGYSHKFKKATGVSPGDYCLFLKLDHARKLLENRAMPLANVALLCGFTDSNYMIRAFKKRFGITPGAYRNSFHLIPH